MTRHVWLAALTVLELTPPRMVTCAAEAGHSHIGIRLLPATPNEPRYDIVGDTPMLREVRPSASRNPELRRKMSLAMQFLGS